MMRQYELVERVRRYNPHADEDLLNRAYVFAMKAHGAQKRTSGDPLLPGGESFDGLDEVPDTLGQQNGHLGGGTVRRHPWPRLRGRCSSRR